MQKMKPGVIGFMPKDAEFFSTLETYAKMGYKAYEQAGRLFQMGDPVEGAKRVRAMGLELLSIGTVVQGSANPKAADLVKQANSIGVKRVTIGHTSAAAYRFADRPELPDEKEIMTEIGKLAALATDLKKEGISLTFHNHDTEFTAKYGDKQLFWMIAEHCPDIRFEPDLGWAQYAGEDPIDVINRLGERTIALHVKDYIPGDNFEYKPHKTFRVPRYCAPGAGVVDLYGCFEAAVQYGVEWAIIEQDMQYILNHEQAAQAAIYNMRETGFVV